MSNSMKGGRMELFWMWRSFGVVIDTRVFTLVSGTNPPTLFWLAGAVLFRLSAWKLQYFCFTFHQFNSFEENKHQKLFTWSSDKEASGCPNLRNSLRSLDCSFWAASLSSRYCNNQSEVSIEILTANQRPVLGY